MPLRPDLPSGLNLSRRSTTPVKLPKMSFPMLGDTAEQESMAANPVQEEVAVIAAPETAPANGEEETEKAPALPAAGEGARVIVYGKSGCQACMDAIRDLMDRQVSFTYHDVSRDMKARQHLQAICGAEAVVPVIVQIGYSGV